MKVEMDKKHILVTGGAGFIGSNIIAHHLLKGDHVWAIDNLQTGRQENIGQFLKNSSFRFEKADLRNWTNMDEAVNWADRVYHMAADVGQRYVISHPIDTLSNNINSYELILKAIAKSSNRPRLVLASTSELYAHRTETTDHMSSEDEMLIFPSGKFIQQTYAGGKYINELMTLAYVNEKDLHCAIARIYNTIGMNQTSSYGMVFPTFIEQALANQPLTVYGDGLQTRSFCNVKDTVEALEQLLENNSAKGEIVNVGNDVECSINDLAKKIIARSGSRSTIKHISYRDAYGIDFIDIRTRRPNLEKLKRLTGFSPKWTLEQTIDELVENAKNLKGKL